MNLPQDWLEQIKAVYPKRPGQWWAEVRTLVPRAIGFGATWNQIIDGTRAYARYCQLAGVQPQHVRSAKHFFDWRVQGWAEDWEIPEPADPAKAREEKLWQALRERAKASGFREPWAVESLGVYETALREHERESRVVQMRR